MKKNSERLPGKNLRAFNGRPLFTIILETLNNHPLIGRIVVNSDSSEILDYVNSNVSKGIAINRPEFLKDSYIGANDLIADDIQFAESEHLFQTHCTNPLLTPLTITRAIEQYFDVLPEIDSLFSATKIQNRLYHADTKPLNHSNTELLRLQDMKPVYLENACFFIFSKTSFANAGNSRVGKAPLLFEVSPIEGIDIDFENDFLLAELIERNKSSFPSIF